MNLAFQKENGELQEIIKKKNEIKKESFHCDHLRLEHSSNAQ